MLKQPSTLSNVAIMLQRSENYYLTRIDHQGNYTYMNEYFQKKYSFFYGSSTVRHAGAALHPDDHDKSFATYQKCMAEPNQTFHVTLRKLDGVGGYIITHWEYKADVDGSEIAGVIGIGYDITAFESRKEHIKYLTQTLNSVAHQQSHQIRRPVANIIGLLELLNESEDPQTLKIAGMLQQSCNELNDELDEFFVRDIINPK